MLNRYPFDFIVSSIYRYAPRDRPRRDVRILEVGCGSANNLWFAAREGFSVAGIDGSKAAIDFAGRRFKEEGLEGDLQVGDMTDLPYPARSFDLVIDRGALTCVSFSVGNTVVREIRRVLKAEGIFIFNPYSSRCTSFLMSSPGKDGLRENIHGGSLTGVGNLCFYDREQINSCLGNGWSLLDLQHLEITHDVSPMVHAEWRIVARTQSL